MPSYQEIAELEESPAPDPERLAHLAFVGAYHGEGTARLDRLFRQVRPWAGLMIVALQGATEDEHDVACMYADVVIEQDTLGFCEASFPAIEEALARYPEATWAFSMDGDELADAHLLASLSLATDPSQVADSWRIWKRTTLQLQNGDVIPGLTEANLRLYRTYCTRPPKPHAWVEGVRHEPSIWPLGAIREHRTMREYITDQMRYASLDTGITATTATLLNKTYAHLRQFLDVPGALAEFRNVANDAYDIVKENENA